MASIAAKTAAVPAIVCSSDCRNSDGGTRVQPSGIGPGRFRSAGTSPGFIRNNACPNTSPASAGLAASSALDENPSHLRSVTLKYLPVATPRVPNPDQMENQAISAI